VSVIKTAGPTKTTSLEWNHDLDNLALNSEQTQSTTPLLCKKEKYDQYHHLQWVEIERENWEETKSSSNLLLRDRVTELRQFLPMVAMWMKRRWMKSKGKSFPIWLQICHERFTVLHVFTKSTGIWNLKEKRGYDRERLSFSFILINSKCCFPKIPKIKKKMLVCFS